MVSGVDGGGDDARNCQSDKGDEPYRRPAHFNSVMCYSAAMIYLIFKAVISGVLIATASEVARRWPGWGALIVSLPLVSILAMLWLWRDTHDPVRMAAHVEATFWFVIPSLPMFLLIPSMLRQGYSFWSALLVGCVVTIGLYLAMTWIGPRFGLRL